MTCAFEFQELASRNPFVKSLDDLGYHADFVGGYFIIYGLPYLDKDGALKFGDLATPLDLSSDGVIGAPNNHQAWFRGEKPHNQARQQLAISIRDHIVTVTPEFIANYSFSFKLLDDAGQKRAYNDFEEKIQTYLHVITAPAIASYPDASPLRGIEIKAAAQGSPLQFPDTSSASYHLNDISSLLRGKKVAIIGLGGTGSYILDFLARTHLEQIALFDDDTVHVHTIFRIPGFIPNAIGKPKVEALAQHYRNWHSGIEHINERITHENVERLRGFDFVFVSVDDGPARLFILQWLSANAMPYVDCGMGLNRSVGGLNGTVRITGTDSTALNRAINTAYLPTGDAKEDEYRKQAQIAELNALNAALAVIRFKQHFQLFERIDSAASYIFETATVGFDKI